MNTQHVQVPDMDLKKEGLLHNDPYVYACIKRYMNNESKIAFPSLSTLVNNSGLHKTTIISSIERLEKAGYLSIIKEFGKANKYQFNDYKKFEIFSYDFLDNVKLTAKQKAYIVATQQYMFKDPESSTGIIKFDSERMAEAIGLSLPTLRKREKELQAAGILSLIPSNQKELIKDENGNYILGSGMNIYHRIYNFPEFCNLLAMKFQQTDEHLNLQDQKIDAHSKEIEDMKNEIRQLKEQLKLNQITL